MDGSAESAPRAEDDLTDSLFAALPRQLGLKLAPATEPVPVLVIDRAEKPSPN